ncbi:phage holin family protein [Streptomyces sp. NPDC051940]|uniref:phage holin family protein n=1 Tax=Streptomyces sp. NPDC051940 TaxID=3155675 RepID=UPI00343783C6
MADARTNGGRLRTAGAAVMRSIVVWAVATLTMLVLAGILPDFSLEAEDGDSATRLAITAAIGAGAFGVLSALVWPVIVRALLFLPAFVLGLLVFFLNGYLLWIAISLIPEERGYTNPETAIVVAAVMSATSSATSTALAVRDDGAYRRRLARLADRRGAAECGPDAAPGTVFIQLDGVGHDVLQEAIARKPPLMETVAAWHRQGSHRLTPWRTDWSSQTGASQLGILHGTNHGVPAFRWYEKKTGQVMVCNRPASAAEIQRRAAEHTGHAGLLAGEGGASRGNLFTGGAEQLALVLSVAGVGGRHGLSRSRSGYFAYFADPANASRTFASFIAEVFRELGQSIASRVRRDSPRMGRGGLYPFLRAFATVVERDVVVAAVMGDMLAGRRVIYADLVAYDEVAHYAGPHHRDTHQVLRRLDRAVRMISKLVRYAPRDYRIVLLSDHGQSEGPSFAAAYGVTLQDLVRAGCGLPVSRRANRRLRDDEAMTALHAALKRTKETEAVVSAGPVVLGSGNLGLVSFPDVPERLSREEIDRRHPALLTTLAEHPGIGFLLVHSEEHGPVVLGAGGGEHRLRTGRVVGRDPLAAFGPGAARAVARTDTFPHVADIMVNSAYDEEHGRVHAFEDQIGSHGGLGGSQNRAFLLWPAELTPPVRPEEELVGAEHVHAVLRGWLDEAERGRGAVSDEAAGEMSAEPAG